MGVDKGAACGKGARAFFFSFFFWDGWFGGIDIYVLRGILEKSVLYDSMTISCWHLHLLMTAQMRIRSV
jgi:hypothetical protein